MVETGTVLKNEKKSARRQREKNTKDYKYMGEGIRRGGVQTLETVTSPASFADLKTPFGLFNLKNREGRGRYEVNRSCVF